MELTDLEVKALRNGVIPSSLLSRIATNQPTLVVAIHVEWKPDSRDEYDPDGKFDPQDYSDDEALLLSFEGYSSEPLETLRDWDLLNDADVTWSVLND